MQLAFQRAFNRLDITAAEVIKAIRCLCCRTEYNRSRAYKTVTKKERYV